MTRIYISYRRDDSAGHTGRLMDDMKEEFEPEHIVRAIEPIDAGANFIEVIDQAVGSCTLLLAVIGPRWLGTTDPRGNRRLEHPHDLVRLEIAAALARHDIKVIPVLVGGATMPAAEDLPEPLKPLARYRAHEITEQRWDYEVGRLLRTMTKMPGIARRRSTAASAATRAAPPPAEPPRRSIPTGLKMLFGVIGVGFVLVIYAAFHFNKSETNLTPTTGNIPASDGIASTAQMADSSPLDAVSAAAAGAHIVKDPSSPTASAGVRPSIPAQPEAVATLDVAGNWRTEAGDAFYIKQSGNQLTVMAVDVMGNQGSTGRGVLRGQQVELTLTHPQSGGTASMRMKVSPDGRRMIGMAEDHGSGSSQNLTLLRE